MPGKILTQAEVNTDGKELVKAMEASMAVYENSIKDL